MSHTYTYTSAASERAAKREAEIAETLDLARFCDTYCRLNYAADLRTGVVAGPPTDADPDDYCCYCNMLLPESREPLP